MQKINHIPTADEAYNKYSALCARQECCRHDLAEKMVRKGMSEQAIATVLEQLTSEGFIDEERFCRAFIHDKLHFSKWGKIRLRTELRMRRIAHETIEQCLREIDDEDYCKPTPQQSPPSRHTKCNAKLYVLPISTDLSKPCRFLLPSHWQDNFKAHL